MYIYIYIYIYIVTLYAFIYETTRHLKLRYISILTNLLRTNTENHLYYIQEKDKKLLII